MTWAAPGKSTPVRGLEGRARVQTGDLFHPPGRARRALREDWASELELPLQVSQVTTDVEVTEAWFADYQAGIEGSSALGPVGVYDGARATSCGR